MSNVNIPTTIHCERASASHVQGIAVDTAHEYIYVSYTTSLCKYDIKGNLIGSVIGLTGHLGCLDFNDGDGKVYGSIEYKHDAIGKGIIKALGNASLADEDAFYIAIFDVNKIDRLDMDAEKDGVMTAVYLPEVVDDYHGVGENGEEHRYCCSGIDGTTIGPVFGAGKDSPTKVFVAYGVYGKNERNDNDHQVILQYDWKSFSEAAKPLSQLAPHHSAVECEEKYFVYTGNTTYGIQNLEYDAFTGDYFAAVYTGKKPEFPNYAMFRIDGSVAAVEAPLKGLDEKGKLLTLKKAGEYHAESDTYGYRFPHGSTGLYSFGDGRFYISHHYRYEAENSTPEKKVYVFGTDTKLYNLKEDNELFELA